MPTKIAPAAQAPSPPSRKKPANADAAIDGNAPSTQPQNTSGPDAATYTFWRDKAAALLQETGRLSSKITALRRDMLAAGAAEDWHRAGEFQAEIAGVQALLDTAKVDISACNSKSYALYNEAAQQFFFGKTLPSETQSLTQVLATDPVTGVTGETYYRDSGERVTLHVAGFETFDGQEAYHLSDWAFKHGLYLQYRKRTVVFDGPADEH